MICVITMAGLGSRFRDAGFEMPKYEIEVHGRPLFDWSLISLKAMIQTDAQFIFISLTANRSRRYIEQRCAVLGIRRFAIVEIEALTDGQATTVLAAEPLLVNESEPGFTIFNIDTHIEPAALARVARFDEPSILCFPGRGSAWSFAKTGDDGYATTVEEKVRISDHASVGLYSFASFAQFKLAYELTYGQTSAAPNLKERYIAPMYNTLIRSGTKVSVPSVGETDVVPLGTPVEVAAFRARAMVKDNFGDRV